MQVQELAGCSWGDLAFDINPIEVDLTEDAVNELGLHQVDVALTPPDVDPKEVGNGPFYSDLESSCLHFIHHFQKFSMLQASEDEVVSVET